MEIIICVLGILLNAGLFMCLRKTKHQDSFFQSLAMGITVAGTVFCLLNQMVFWVNGKTFFLTAGVLMIIGGSAGAFLLAFRKERIPKFQASLQESMFGGLTLVMCVGLIFYRGFYHSVENLMRVVQWSAAGMLFFSLMGDKMKKKSASVMGFAFSIMFLIGYPLANAIYGNMVLAVTMNWVLLDLIMFRLYPEETISDKWCFGMLAMEGVFFAICYPAGIMIFLLLVAPIFWKMARGTNILVPGLMLLSVIMVAVINIFFSYGSFQKYDTYYFEQCRALFINGWSDVGFFVFPILLYIYYRLEHKQHMEQLYWPVAGIIGYLLVIKTAEWMGQNTYDDFNLLYLIWILFMYIGVTGFLEALEEFNSFLIAYGFTILFVFCLMLSGIEETLQEMNIWYCVEVKADAYLKVYDWNWKALKDNKAPSQEMQDLIAKCSELRFGSPDMVIPCVITDKEYLLEEYYRRTGQEEFFRYMYMQQKNLLNAKQEQQTVWDENIFTRYKNMPYVMVERNCKLYWFGIGIYGYAEVVYENDYGLILKFN